MTVQINHITDTITSSNTSISISPQLLVNSVDVLATAQTASNIAVAAFNKANTSGPGSANIAILDEGVYLTNSVSSMNFVGSGVAATTVGTTVTITISGGGGTTSAAGLQDIFMLMGA